MEIESFRCIRKASFTLEPLTVLVGPNASGKSAVLDALDPSRELAPEDHRNRIKGRIRVSLEQASGAAYERTESQERGGRPHRRQLVRLDLQRLRAPNQVAFAETITDTGENLANVFGSLTRKQQEALSKLFCSLVPVYRDVDVVPVANGYHQLRFQAGSTPTSSSN